MEQEEIKEIEEIEAKAEVEQPLTEVVDKQDVDTLVIELKQEYEKKLLEQKQMYEGKLKERDNIIKQVLTADNSKKQPDYIDEINKRRNAQNKI